MLFYLLLIVKFQDLDENINNNNNNQEIPKDNPLGFAFEDPMQGNDF